VSLKYEKALLMNKRRHLSCRARRRNTLGRLHGGRLQRRWMTQLSTAILRHSHVSVTQACYIKTNRPELEAAMRNFSEELRKCSQVVLETEGSETPEVLQ
jgi:hypothetical protein